jgi:hypothetical protein
MARAVDAVSLEKSREFNGGNTTAKGSRTTPVVGETVNIQFVVQVQDKFY